jgi:hypothetical protein
VSVRYVELADYLAIAAEITGLDTQTLIRVTKVDLAAIDGTMETTPHHQLIRNDS